MKGMLQERKAMKGEMDRRLVYGSEDFTDKVRKKYDIEGVVKLRGRPRKDKVE